MDKEPVTTDKILEYLTDAVKAGKSLSKDAWMNMAFRLNILLADEHLDLENYRALVSVKKQKLYQAQEGKKNVAAVELEIEASEEYRQYKLQEHRVERIEEFVRLAKKNASDF